LLGVGFFERKEEDVVLELEDLARLAPRSLRGAVIGGCSGCRFTGAQCGAGFGSLPAFAVGALFSDVPDGDSAGGVAPPPQAATASDKESSSSVRYRFCVSMGILSAPRAPPRGAPTSRLAESAAPREGAPVVSRREMQRLPRSKNFYKAIAPSGVTPLGRTPSIR
jgi:hypothetical protein